MKEATGIALASIFLLGIGAQWFAWRFRAPAILLLLLVGLIAGPATGFLNPDAVFGRELILSIVSFSVAVIMFEGSLSLKFKDIKEVGGTVFSLVTVGMLVSWGFSTVAGHYIFDLEWNIAALIGGILVVTGPTVIGPLLRQIRPKKRIGSILKWEGIMIDPIGALAAVLVFEAVIQEATNPRAEILNAILLTLGAGLAIGLVCAALMVIFIRRFWIPEFLHSPFMLMVVIGTFALSNQIQSESGLLTVTVLGVALANQKFVKVEHILEFKENLQVLLISSLFVLLAARIPMETLTKVGSAHALFLLSLIVIGRPLSILASTLFSNTNWKERAFLAMLAPRGIVAAAVASIFALELEEIHHPAAETIVPIVFFVIVGSVLIYGLSATPLARRLGLADQNPQGVLFIGANPVSIALAKLLTEKGFRTMLVDTNWNNVRSARAQELPVLQGNILAERTMDELDLEGIGKVFAMTPNSEINTLSLIHLTHVFTRENAYHLPGVANDKNGPDLSESFQHRTLFANDLSYQKFSSLLSQGASIKSTKLSKEFDLENFKTENGERAQILAVISENGLLEPVTTKYRPKMKGGASLIYLQMPEEAPVNE